MTLNTLILLMAQISKRLKKLENMLLPIFPVA